ncbi:MAG: hydroxylamine reductase, partial [Desulfobacterales bacterium]|nr:hydroxylamine reductase [Desulfobacterales bacterium]
MFCFQCEQTSKGEGCTKIGVCGKKPDVAALQDLLVYAVKGLSLYAIEGARLGIKDSSLGRFTGEALFATLTNVDFDPQRFVPLIRESVERRQALQAKITAAGGKTDFAEDAARFSPAATLEELVAQGEKVGVNADPSTDPNLRSLRELLIYGIKGVAAYADHARILGREDEAVYAFIFEAMAATLNPALGIDDLVGLVLKCG